MHVRSTWRYRYTTISEKVLGTHSHGSADTWLKTKVNGKIIKNRLFFLSVAVLNNLGSLLLVTKYPGVKNRDTLFTPKLKAFVRIKTKIIQSEQSCGESRHVLIRLSSNILIKTCKKITRCQRHKIKAIELRLVVYER